MLASLYDVGGNVNKVVPSLRQPVWRFLKKLKIESRNSNSRCILKRTESRFSKRYLYTNAHSNLAHFTVAKIRIWFKYPSLINGQANGVYASNRILFSLKKEGNLTYATTWMKPEDIMLSEISQSHKDKCYMTSLKWNTNSQNRQEVQWRLPGAGEGLER